MTMGEKIKALRISHGLSQERLGAMLNPPVNRAAVNKWETGRVENIKRIHIQQMATIFNVAPTDLMCIYEEEDINKSKNAEQLLEIFRKLSPENQEKILELCRLYIASQQKK